VEAVRRQINGLKSFGDVAFALNFSRLHRFMKRYLPFIIVAVVAIATLGSGAMLYRARLPHRLTVPKDKSVSGKGDVESMHVRGNPEAAGHTGRIRRLSMPALWQHRRFP
jgi:hypothetical protein